VKSNVITKAQVLDAISDDNALKLFDAIANDGEESSLEKLKMTRKQYYTRLAKLVKTGLVKRQKRKYTITSFGKVVYNIHLTFYKAMENSWKFKAIDAMIEKNELSAEEYQKALDLLLDKDSDRFKQILFNTSTRSN
jgi:predicted transcriptional regulator